MKRIYFDHQATTPIHPEVLSLIENIQKEIFGNPQSSHSFGFEAKKLLEEAREKIASLLNVSPSEIYFTSSGAESNNWAIKGVAFANQNKGNHIIISAIEHSSVIQSAKRLEKKGFEVTYLKVDKYGVVDLEELRKKIKKETILISVMHANYEVGTIEPIKEISEIAKENKIIFHSDGVATAGQLKIDLKELGVDLYTISSHTFYGPKGVALLYIKRGTKIEPLIEGGIQENNRRAGTENLIGIIGMAKAYEIAIKELEERKNKLERLRNRLIDELPKKIDNIYLTGHPKNRLPNHASFCVEYVEGEAMVLYLNSKGIACASGSACSSKQLKASHVLLAMGISPVLAQGSIIFTLGIDNSEEDIDYLLEVFPPIVKKLREISPLYKNS
ncbi:MAG: cysteine desulfurase [candidate division WOR-3 bacterium]|nr:cysteine desulfurase [candidate division WOR-3 bacterium]MDW8113505.1 cysteine desulfurase family protein [candidate division WOR-3 bacterium]